MGGVERERERKGSEGVFGPLPIFVLSILPLPPPPFLSCILGGCGGEEGKGVDRWSGGSGGVLTFLQLHLYLLPLTLSLLSLPL